MKRWLLFALLLIALPGSVAAQNTSVSGTITDLGGVVWKNGTYSFTWQPSPQNPTANYSQNGVPFNKSTTISGALDGTGSLTSVAIPDNLTIIPSGSTYAVQVCPLATATNGCYKVQLTITGASQSITASVVPPAIVVNMMNPPPGGVSAYTDAEISGARVGNNYFNLTDSTIHLCLFPACTWQSLAGTGTVSTTGSPAAGNLTKFSGATSITNGDLTGDVTTSGTTATTLASTIAGAKTWSNLATFSAGITGTGSIGSLTVPFTGVTGSIAIGQTPLTTRGDLLTVNATPALARLGLGGANLYPKSNGTDLVYSTLAAGGVGSPTACANQVVTQFTLNADAAPTSTCSSLTTAFLPTTGNWPFTGAFTGNYSVTGNETNSGVATFTNLNGCIIVEPPTYGLTNAGIQAAVNATPSGGCVFLPTGTYALTATTNEQIKLVNPINFICAGWGTILQVGSSVGAIPVIHVLSNGENNGVRIQDCSILPQSGTPGSTGILVDVPVAHDLEKIIIEHVQIGLLDQNFFIGGATQLGGPAITLSGLGFLGDIEIEHSYLAGGIQATALGDSVTIAKNIIQGTGNGIDATCRAGASSLRIQDNTINPRTGAALHLGACMTFPIIVGNEFETPNSTGTGSNGAFVDIDGLLLNISTISVTANVVTLTATTNFPVGTYVGEQVFVAGVTNSLYNGGPFTIASWNGTTQITYPQTLSTTSSSGGTVGNPTSGVDLEKNQCQMVSGSTLNCMRFNYAQSSVVRDNNFVLPTTPGVDITLTVNSSSTRLKTNNFNGVTFAQAISDSSSLGNTFYDFGGQNLPDVPLVTRDKSNTVNYYGGGTTNQLFGAGVTGANYLYDGNANAVALVASNASSAVPAASTGVSVYKLFAVGSQPQATLGIVGASGQLSLLGSTSGAATISAPAVAGTVTNPVVSSNYFQATGFVLSNTNNLSFVPASFAANRTVNVNDPGATVNLDFTSNTTTTTSQLLHGSATAGVGTWSAFAPATDCATCVTSAAALTSNSVVLGNGGQAAKTATFLTTDGAATLTVGVAGGGNGVLALAGTTSGTATFTAPSVAGTRTNNVVSTNSMLIPGISIVTLADSATLPTIAGAGCGGSGATIINANGTAAFEIGTGTTPTSGGCTVTMPAAAHSWTCSANSISAITTTDFVIVQTGAISTTSVVLQVFSDVAAASAPIASDTWRVMCRAN
jgi:hypothetical protein